jgi:hypothetical protein
MWLLVGVSESIGIALWGIRGFKSCHQDRNAATVVAIELLLKGFAGARNQLHLEFTSTAA